MSLSQIQHWVKKYFTSGGVCEHLTSTVTVKLTCQVKSKLGLLHP
jgi:hypothetical protein